MNAPARATPATPILRNAAGEPPLGIGGLAFRDDQGEMFFYDRDRSPAARFGVLELEDGSYIVHPFHVDSSRFADRAAALRFAIAGMVRKTRKYMRAKEDEGIHWSEGLGGRVIEWALDLKPARRRPAVEGQHPILRDTASGNDVAISGASAAPRSDPIVAELVAAHRARKLYPAGHTFSMTNPVLAGEMKTAGTCSCNHVFAFPGGDHERMDAAIEAHWQKFDSLPERVDGRGQPISSSDGDVESRHVPEGTAPVAARGLRGRRPRDLEAAGSQREAEAGRPPEMARVMEQASSRESQDSDRIAGPSAARVRAGVAPGPSEAIQPGTGGQSSVPNIADAPQHPRLEPAPDAPPDGAGSTLSALRAIAAGGQVDGPVALDLVRKGLVHATTTRISLTEAGEALLKDSDGSESPATDNPDPAALSVQQGLDTPATDDDIRDGGNVENPEGQPNVPDGSPVSSAPSETEQPAPIGAGSVADVKCLACEPAQICAGPDEYLAGILARDETRGGAGNDCSVGKRGVWSPEGADGQKRGLNVGPEPDVTGGESAAPLSDDDDLAIEWPSYDAFLEDKIVTAPMRGIEVKRDDLHPWLKPHCKDLTLWALRLGCAAIFANFGLHKTAMQLEWCRQLHKNVGGATLNVVPLGVRHGFIKEALQLSMDVRFIRTNAEFHALSAEGVVHFLTNYESIREGKLDPNLFMATSLDEASVLRSYGSKTYQEFLPLFSKVEFKLVATATPSPNRYKELIHYAGFLGVMDTGLALTRWFQRNSEKAGDLTLYPHKENEFWMWIHSWAAFVQKPSDLGYSDEGYELPPLKLNWCEVPADHSKAKPERDGQGTMFRNVANGLSDMAKSRRDSLSSRIAKMSEIIAQDPDSHRVIWHDLEAEREAIEAALPEVVTIHGTMHLDDREKLLHDFEEGRVKYFGTKPILSGSGSNFQYHCHKAVYVGMPGDGYKFNDFIQSIYRLQRFGQQHPVEVDIIYSEDMRAGRAALEEKWALDTAMRQRMSEIIKKHGLNVLPMRDALARTMGIKRVEIRGQNFIAINNDCVAECRAWPDNSVDQIITSIPFSNHYEYSASYRDFGHTDDNGHFWSQMDFLTCELMRILKPGRLACIHVKDRVLFGSATGAGFSTVSSFHEEAVMHYKAHGFWKMGMIHIDTDVVKENADGSYRLGWSENCKDSTTKGVGSPEYVLIMRKGQSDRTRGYADVPVVKEKWDGEGLPADQTPNDGYSRARWQIDAHAFWRSSGNRLLTADEFADLPAQTLRKIFAKVSSERIYDYEAHVQIGERLERVKELPAQWSCLAPGATNENTWHDVIRMHTLNSKQVQQGREKHICPLQFDIVDRLIHRYSNEGDLVLDPFGGIGTVAYRAMLKKRRGAIIELSATYFLDAVDHCRAAESKIEVPQLFDLVEFDAVNTPPPQRT